MSKNANISQSSLKLVCQHGILVSLHRRDFVASRLQVLLFYYHVKKDFSRSRLSSFGDFEQTYRQTYTLARSYEYDASLLLTNS